MKRIIFAFIALLGPVTLTVAAGTRTYYFDIDSTENRSREKLVISENGAYTDYRWFRADGTLSYYVRYTNRVEILEAKISGSQGASNALHLRFDRTNNRLLWTGSINAEMPVVTNVILDKTVFYIFSQVFPESNQTVYFQMLQPYDLRVVDMYLKWDGLEKIKMNGRTYQTVRYEFAVANPFAGMFWPYKYYYWYSLTNRKLVKHTGVEHNLSNESITLFEK